MTREEFARRTIWCGPMGDKAIGGMNRDELIDCIMVLNNQVEALHSAASALNELDALRRKRASA